MKKFIVLISAVIIINGLQSCDRTSEHPDIAHEMGANTKTKSVQISEKIVNGITLYRTEVLSESRASKLGTNESLLLNYASLKFNLIMQSDGNLVLYLDRGYLNGNSTVLWSTNTSSIYAPYDLIAQNDGNLVIYRRMGYIDPIWSTNTTVNYYISNPLIKLQYLKRIHALNSGSPRYFIALMLEGNGSDRKKIFEIEVMP